jgi:hypothetical protein
MSEIMDRDSRMEVGSNVLRVVGDLVPTVKAN